MIQIVQVSCKDREQAQEIARQAVDRRLAACAQIMSPMESVYSWQGAIESSPEVPLILKTTKERIAKLQSLVTELHSYEVPEFIVVESSHCLPAYAEWVVESTDS